MTRIPRKYIPDAKPKDCKGLSDYVYDLIHSKGKDSPEFHDLLKIYTKEHLRGLYKQARFKKGV